MLLRKKEEIEAWLNKYKIENYELIEDQEYGYMVNVNNNVFLNHKNLKSLEVKFNKINGYFDCCHNELTSLEGCPKIIKEYFDCSSNKLKSLKGCPEIVDGTFFCNNNNELISLEGCPEIVNGEFFSNNNDLSIEGMKYLPKKIKDNIIFITNNKKLGEFQDIEDFKELKEKLNDIFNINEEKNNLLNIINKDNDDLIINKKRDIRKI